MNGFKKLSSDVREEMLADAKDFMRRLAFREARRKSEQCDLDEYIMFLSEGMEFVTPEPTKRVTIDFRL
jgi:hypothetical protein